MSVPLKRDALLSYVVHKRVGKAEVILDAVHEGERDTVANATRLVHVPREEERNFAVPKADKLSDGRLASDLNDLLHNRFKVCNSSLVIFW